MENAMASRKEIVTFSGLLRGNGLESPCTIRALKVSLPGAGPPAYTRYEIARVLQALPEGVYQLFAQGGVSNVRLANGFWISAQP
jgi:hypothetical protein